MSGLSDKYNYKAISAHLWQLTHMPAVIVGVEAQDTTQFSGKFGETPPDVVAQRYRIRLLGIDPPDKPENRLPLAYPLQLTSGLGAQDSGIIRYTPNTYVYVSKDPNSEAYYIERVIPNAIAKLFKSDSVDLSGTGIAPYSGFIPGVTVVPDPFVNELKTDLNSAELFNTQLPSLADVNHDYKTKLPKIKSACDTVNVDGVNDAIEGMIKDVEALKTGLTGDDSFLATTQNFLSDANTFVTQTIPNASLFNVGIGTNSISVGTGVGIGTETGTDYYDISIGNAAGDIGRIIAALVQKVRKWILRKITTVANVVIGKVPLSARYLANELEDKALTAVSCAIAKVLANLEGMIANILKSIVDKILNAAECLVENVIGGIIGNILGNITGVINGILSKLGDVFSGLGASVGAIIDLAGDMLDFVISILDVFTCKAENLCPDSSTWDFLQGSKPSKNKTLNFDRIFKKARGVTATVADTVGNISTEVLQSYDEVTREGFQEVIFSKDDGTEFNPLDEIDSGIIWQNIIDGGCNTDAVNCGPPNVVFFGGDGDGATGNPVVNLAGELIGVDIVQPGQYVKAPLVSFEDPCGNGKGAIGRPVIGKVKNKNKIVYRWRQKKVKIKEGEVARLMIIRSGRTDVTSRIRVKTLRNKGTASFNDDFKFKKEIIEFKPGQTAKIFKIKARAKGGGGEGFRNTDIEGKEHFYVSIKVKKLKKKDNKGIKNLDKIKLKIKKNRKYVKVVITDKESEVINYDEPTPLELPPETPPELPPELPPETPPGLPPELPPETPPPPPELTPLDDDDEINEDDILKDDDNSDQNDPEDDDELDDDFDDDDDDDDEIGITDVIIENSGYGYEAYPYGDKGGMGRVWANRCQTSVHRANYDWDRPYSKGDTVTVYYGDEITFPGEQKIVIDEKFTEDMIPGCVIKGTNPKIKDMSEFDYTVGKTYDKGIKHQFGAFRDLKDAKEQGFSDQDVRFFLTKKFFLRVGPKMRDLLDDSDWGKIPEYSVTFTAPGCPPGTPEDPNEPPTSKKDEGDKKVAILGGVAVKDPGFGYDADDKLIIDGADGELIINNGAIIGVKITNPGIGFTTLPEIRINTKTGFNADLKPVLRFIDVNDSGFVVPLGTPTLQVIDCVGKV